jgi:hypothetical protein
MSVALASVALAMGLDGSSAGPIDHELAIAVGLAVVEDVAIEVVAVVAASERGARPATNVAIERIAAASKTTAAIPSQEARDGVHPPLGLAVGDAPFPACWPLWAMRVPPSFGSSQKAAGLIGRPLMCSMYTG